MDRFIRFGEAAEAAAETATSTDTATETGGIWRGIDWDTVWTKLSEFLVSIGGKLLLAILLVIVFRVVIRLTLRVLRRSRALKKADPGASRFIINLVRILLNVIMVVTVIGVMGVPMSSVVAVIAAASAAIGLALQGALSNFAGGIMILIFHPFHLEDFIDAGGHMGTVTDIGIFYTVLKTPDGKEITIPNGTVMAEPLVNYSAYDTRRLDLVFAVAYGTDMETVRRALLETASAHELVLSDPEPFARLTAHEESALKFTLRVWVKKGDYWTVNFDLIEQIHRRFASDGIRVPFNQLDVHVDGAPARDGGKGEKTE